MAMTCIGGTALSVMLRKPMAVVVLVTKMGLRLRRMVSTTASSFESP